MTNYALYSIIGISALPLVKKILGSRSIGENTIKLAKFDSFTMCPVFWNYDANSEAKTLSSPSEFDPEMDGIRKIILTPFDALEPAEYGYNATIVLEPSGKYSKWREKKEIRNELDQLLTYEGDLERVIDLYLRSDSGGQPYVEWVGLNSNGTDIYEDWNRDEWEFLGNDTDAHMFYFGDSEIQYKPYKDWVILDNQGKIIKQHRINQTSLRKR